MVCNKYGLSDLPDAVAEFIRSGSATLTLTVSLADLNSHVSTLRENCVTFPGIKEGNQARVFGRRAERPIEVEITLTRDVEAFRAKVLTEQKHDREKLEQYAAFQYA